MNLADRIDEKEYVSSLELSLTTRTGAQRFPNDNEVKEALRTKDVYNIKSKNRIYLLERLENYENPEQVQIIGNEKITIEHIFPQNPEGSWKLLLSDSDYNELRETYLNTIGNLTLSGNNGKLGNKNFAFKRDLPDAGYKDSKLYLNKKLSEYDNWNIKNLLDRYENISYRFFQIWKYPIVESSQKENSGEINIFEAEDPTSKKLEYAVFLDRKLKVNQVSKLYLEVIKQLFDIQPETFFNTNLRYSIKLTKNPKADGLRKPKEIDEMYFIETNYNNIDKFKRIKEVLEVFEIEDELLIKFEDE